MLKKFVQRPGVRRTFRFSSRTPNKDAFKIFLNVVFAKDMLKIAYSKRNF